MSLLDALSTALIDELLAKVFYWPGWLVLRCLTLGHYPPKEREVKHNEYFVGFIGFLAFTAAGIAFLAL